MCACPAGIHCITIINIFLNLAFEPPAPSGIQSIKNKKIISFTVNAGGKKAQGKRVRNSKSSAIIDKQLKCEVLMIVKRIFK